MLVLNGGCINEFHVAGPVFTMLNNHHKPSFTGMI
jgi:hypothetical protein